MNEALLQPGAYTETGIELEGGEAMSNGWMWLSAAELIAAIERPLSDRIADVRDSGLE